jgi:hypothetical protein
LCARSLGQSQKEAQVAHSSRPAGARLVMDELLRRGFDARLADRNTQKYDVWSDYAARHLSPFI